LCQICPMDVSQMSALRLERCPQSTWNAASWVVHAAPVRWVDNREGRFEGNRDQRKQRQRDKATFALLQSRGVKGSPAAPQPTPHRRRGTGAPGAAATAAANGPAAHRCRGRLLVRLPGALHRERPGDAAGRPKVNPLGGPVVRSESRRPFWVEEDFEIGLTPSQQPPRDQPAVGYLVTWQAVRHNYRGYAPPATTRTVLAPWP